MASASAPAVTAQTGTDNAPSGPGNTPRGGGRGGRRGGQRGGHNRRDDSPSRGNGGRRRGRGGEHNTQRPQPSVTAAGKMSDTVPSKPPPSDHDSGGGSGERPTGAAATTTEGARGAEGDDVEAEVCFICADDIVHQSVTPCNHRTCHECSLRARAIYKNTTCLHCRTESPNVIFTDRGDKRYQDFTDADFAGVNKVHGISYETKEIEQDTTSLLQYNCPDTECDVACLSWKDLHRHVRAAHQKQLCDICSRNAKVFTHELGLFTREELRRHERQGDRKPGEADATGFKGHPECGFCRERFYDDQALFTHCNNKHQLCPVCRNSTQNPQQQHQYYVDYNSLKEHFLKDHFMCPEPSCLQDQYVVFGSEMDLKSHQLEKHPHGLSKDALRDARRVDMSNFDIRQHDEPHQRRRGRGGAQARGRDPNAEPLPPSSAQALTRAEIAYQRQMELHNSQIHSAQSVAPRTFGGQLTSGNAYVARPTGQQETQSTVNIPRSAVTSTQFPSLQNSSLDDNPARAPAPAQAPVGNPSLNPQEQARRIQHEAVVGRASQLLSNNPHQVAAFRGRVSQYRNNELSAAEMVDSLVLLFDVGATELGKLVNELIELYDNAKKRDELLKAWNNWKVNNDGYPSLPGPSGAPPGQGTFLAGRRIIKIKGAPSQSHRAFAAGNQNQARTWGTTAAAGPSSSVAGPLPRPAAGGVPWAGASASSSSRATPVASRPASGATTPRAPGPSYGPGPPRADAFPSLPAAAKPNVAMAGRHHGAAKWDKAPTNAGNAWGSGDAGGSDAPGDEAEEPANAGKKKGRKGKQQTLFHFG